GSTCHSRRGRPKRRIRRPRSVSTRHAELQRLRTIFARREYVRTTYNPLQLVKICPAITPRSCFSWHGSYQTFAAMSLDQSRKIQCLPARLRSNQWHVKSGETGAQYLERVRCGRKHEQAGYGP